MTACRRVPDLPGPISLMTGLATGAVNWLWVKSPAYKALDAGWNWLARQVIPLDDDRPNFEPELY